MNTSLRESGSPPPSRSLRAGLGGLTLCALACVAGTIAHAEVSRSAFPRALSLAAGDFDGDGHPDLALGAAAGGLLVALDAQGRVSASTRQPLSIETQLPEPAVHLVSGDFDADGHLDLVAAGTGEAALSWLPGLGTGRFAGARTIPLPGPVTALLAADLNRRDGLTDLAIAVESAGGPLLLVFESAAGALRAPPEQVSLPSPVHDLACGQLDGDHWVDLVAATDEGIVLVHGRDRRLSLDSSQRSQVKPARTTRLLTSDPVRAVAVGNYLADAAGRRELAVLADADRWLFLQHGDSENDWILLGEGRVGERAGVLEMRTHPAAERQAASLGARPLRRSALAAPRPTEEALALSVQAATEDPRSSTPTRLSLASKRGTSGDWLVLPRAGEAPLRIVLAPVATFTVNSTADTDDSACDHPLGSGTGNQDCTLREAINAANATADLDAIVFAIPGDGPHTIQPLSALPTISQPVEIDGYTQSGAVANSDASGFNGTLQIELDGSSAGDGVSGLTLTAGASTVRGLVINRFDEDGIFIFSNDGSVVEGNLIGLDATGLVAEGNDTGVRLAADSHRIGGTSAAARNVIAGNSDTNVRLQNAELCQIQGNLIGTVKTGAAAAGGSTFGVVLAGGAHDNSIGGTTAGSRNVISGHATSGVHFTGSPRPTGNLVQGNLVGTNAAGTAALGNGSNTFDHGGVVVATGIDNTIGGTTVVARNVLSGNRNGVFLTGSSSTANHVQGNYIGLAVTGASAVGNSLDGVAIAFQSTGNFVGGTAAGAGNVISGNGSEGIEISGQNSVGGSNTVQGNRIGTDPSGTFAIPNLDDGVEINDTSAQNDLIGGTDPGAGNLISGNGDDGIELRGIDTRVEGNLIGTDVSGTSALPNAEVGIQIDGTFARDNVIGGDGAGNVIAFNPAQGVLVTGDATTLRNTISENSVHSNGGLGIDIGNNGVSENDAGDADAGINGLQNFPVLTAATTAGGSTTIAGTLDSGAGFFTVEFFSSPTCDPSGNGEGETFLGSTQTAAGAFSVPVAPAVPLGHVVTATATDADGSTSEFSDCRTVVAGCSIGTDDLVLDEQAVSDTQVFEACVSIDLGPSFSVTATGDVTFRAPTVRILEGTEFLAGASAVFENAVP